MERRAWVAGRWNNTMLAALGLLVAMMAPQVAGLPLRDVPTPDPEPVAFPPAGTDSCAAPGPLCAAAPPGGAACLAAGVVVRGLLNTVFVQSSTGVAPPAPPQADEDHLVNGNFGIVVAQEVNTKCDSESTTPSACGEASTSDLTIMVPLVITIVTEALTEQTCSSGGTSGFSSGDIAAGGISSPFLPPQAFSAGLPANTPIPLGTLGFLVVNEQSSGGTGDCLHHTGAALRLVLVDPLLEVTVSYVSTNACEPKLVPAILTTSAPSGPGAFPTQTATDSATVAGTGPIPTGTVTFFLCNPAQVTAGVGCIAPNGVQIGAPKVLGGGQATSDATAPAQTSNVGTHCWRAEYSGDTNYIALAHTNFVGECFTTAKRTPGLSTLANPTGFTQCCPLAKDTATLTAAGNAPLPTGTVTFFLCRAMQTPAGCPAGGTLAGSTIIANGVAVSPGFQTTGAEEGWFCWRAQYNGDTVYNSRTHTNTTTECFEYIVPD